MPSGVTAVSGLAGAFAAVVLVMTDVAATNLGAIVGHASYQEGLDRVPMEAAADRSDQASMPEGTTNPLIGPMWVAEDIDGRGVMDFLQSRIAFTDEGAAHGSGGCNAFRGRYERDGDGLAIGPLASTRKACPPAIMDQEARFLGALEEVRRFRFENRLLYLLDNDSQVLVRLWPRE